MKSNWFGKNWYCILIPVIILGLAAYRRYERQKYYRENGKQAFRKHQSQVLSEWRLNSFVPFGSEAEIQGGIETLVSRATGSSSLSPVQKTDLQRKLITLLAAYNAGSYESFCKFRFPADVKWHWVPRATTELDRYFKEGPLFGTDAMFYNFRTNYGFYPTLQITREAPEGMENRFQEYVFQYSNCTFYSNFWTAVSLSSAKCIIAKYLKAPPEVTATPFYAIQKHKCATQAVPFPNLGYADGQADTLIAFDRSISNILHEEKVVQLADIFFFVDTSPPDAPIPIVIRYYWSPTDDQWLPDNLISCTLESLVLRRPIF
jgi:hypothetical protein